METDGDSDAGIDYSRLTQPGLGYSWSLTSPTPFLSREFTLGNGLAHETIVYIEI